MEIKDINLLTDSEVDSRISKLKSELGSDLFMPVHHYQRDEIVKFADYTGDSLELSRISAKTNAKYIVFCGVYFMAEIARALASENKVVFLPNRSAGCPLADFASIEDVEKVWVQMNKDEFIPITYANSHIEIKAFCGENGGLVCTSSNASKLFKWVFNQNKRVFFLPDKNLGINTANELGVKNYYVVNPSNIQEKEIKKADVVIWDGYCPVHHYVFTVEQVKEWRRKEPDAKVIVHPECRPEVVDASDMSGSTAKIKREIEESNSGSKWVVGTEYNFVNRLKNNNPDKFVAPLEISICVNMSKITRRDLLKTLINVKNRDFTEQIIIDSDISKNARVAIERMLELS
ncbi:quinolinate synthase NadA [candidate division WOR-3 bacterium]|nr:quinolinate synthase NadA [candidate division WOR-3 bacterium]